MAWASDENDNVPLANGMPTEELLLNVKIEKMCYSGVGL